MWLHGGDVLTIKKSTGVKSLLDFSANINPLGQPLSVKKAIAESAECAEHYPDPFCRELKKAIGEFEVVDPSWIVCGNGAAEIIFKIGYGLKPKLALIPAPTFSEYESAVLQAGGKVNYFHLEESKGFTMDNGIIEKIAGNDIVFLCNPNNPVGNTLNIALIEEVLCECKKQKAILVIDECFMELTEDRKSGKRFLESWDNLIILGAFTKSFAVPGIRLGYAITSNQVIASMLENTGAPWNVSVPAQLAGVAACGERAFLDKSVSFIKSERIFLQAELARLGQTVFPSQTNYILFKSRDKNLDDRLVTKGIVIRNCSNYVGLYPGFYRVAVKTHEENILLVNALEEALCQKE